MGVVIYRDLLNRSEQDIFENLTTQGIIECRRLNMKRNGEILLFASHCLSSGFEIPQVCVK